MSADVFKTRLEEIASTTTKGNEAGFANSLTVWINKPHVVNRRLCGTRIHHSEVIPSNKLSREYVDSILHHTGFTSIDKTNIQRSTDACIAIYEHFPVSAEHHHSYQTEIGGLAELHKHDILLVVRELLSKQPDKHQNYAEFIVYDKFQESCCFYPLRPLQIRHGDADDTISNSGAENAVVYRFTFTQSVNSSIQLYSSSSSLTEDSERKMSITWLKSQLLLKIGRWSEEENLNTSLTSLKLLNLQQYSTRYAELKAKYGLHFAKIWPEKTDPQKFVFEDVAIATYLLLLWKQDREVKGLTNKQSFVDLGCGNGLLVHILASEGHPGYGIDVRKRKIWDLYGPETVLKEMSITPSGDSLFPGSDWLIGNHSDELTPWIPVMAARSSYSCCYLVLPCCHYDFDARYSFDRQFHRGHTDDTSQYRNYLNFVANVGETCGFVVEEDMMRIPSTKRICFIGRQRHYPNTAEAEGGMDKLRTEFIESRCRRNKPDPASAMSDPAELSPRNGAETVKSDTGGSVMLVEKSDQESWAADFKPRNSIETVRNCISVRPEVKETVVTTVFAQLLSSDTCGVATVDDKLWRKGGLMSVSEAAGLFERGLLQELKCECGGLQTLLRNYSHVFQVTSGMIKLRDFTMDDPWRSSVRGKRSKTTKQRDTSDYLKTLRCYFHDHHPDGCPRSSENCLYAHGGEELREKPKKLKK